MNKWMAIACDEAVSGMEANDGGPFGAVIIRNGEVIGRAHNEVLSSNDPTAHAEILAIRRASAALETFDLSECILYTTCYPCPMCMGAVLWARIPTVYYGATMEDAAQGGFDDAHFYDALRHPQAVLDLHPLDTETAKTVFAKWLSKENRQYY